MLAAIEANRHLLGLDQGEEVHGPLPHAHEALHDLARIVGTEIDALVIVAEQELAAVVVVRVLDVDERVAGVRELEEELLLHLLELARLDLVALVSVRPGEAEELLVAAEDILSDRFSRTALHSAG